MTNRNIIIILFILLISSNTVLAFLLLRKRPAVPGIALYVNGKEFGFSSMLGAETSPFWNNYPYFVLPSEGKNIDSLITFKNKPGNIIKALSRRLTFRYKGYSNYDSLLNFVLEFPQIPILIDSASESNIMKDPIIAEFNDRLYIISKNMEVACEKLGKSYFFILSDDSKIHNIYFPRRETKEVTKLYIDQNIRRSAYF
jgi:hypothetical protein